MSECICVWIVHRSEDKINSAQYEAKTALDLNLRFLLAWASETQTDNRTSHCTVSTLFDYCSLPCLLNLIFLFPPRPFPGLALPNAHKNLFIVPCHPLHSSLIHPLHSCTPASMMSYCLPILFATLFTLLFTLLHRAMFQPLRHPWRLRREEKIESLVSSTPTPTHPCLLYSSFIASSLFASRHHFLCDKFDLA